MQTDELQDELAGASMSDSARTVARNAGYLMSAQLITWLLALLLTLVLPRYLGPEGIGQLQLANSLWAIAGVFVGFGMSTYVIKEVARDPQRTGILYTQTLVSHLALYGLAWVVIGLYVWLAGYRPETIAVIVVIGFSSLAGIVGQSAYAALNGLEKMKALSLADIIGKALTVAIAVPLLLLGYGVLTVAAIIVFTASVTMLYQLNALVQVQPIVWRFDLQETLAMMRQSVSYLTTDAALIVYQQVDVIIISLFLNEVTIGWYGAADRLAGTLYFVPTVFITAVFPLMSRLHEQSPEKLRELIQRSFGLLMVISVPIGLGTFVLADNIAVLIYGPEFVNTGPVLAWMGIVVLLTYQNILLGRFAIAMDRQKLWAAVMVVATAATIPIDLVLIPWTAARFSNGAIGGALAYVITESGMLLFGLFVLSRGFLGRSTAVQAAKLLFAGGVMMAAVWPLRSTFVVLPIGVGALVYGGLVLLLRAVPADDLALLKDSAQRLLVRVRGMRARPAG